MSEQLITIFNLLYANCFRFFYSLRGKCHGIVEIRLREAQIPIHPVSPRRNDMPR